MQKTIDKFIKGTSYIKIDSAIKKENLAVFNNENNSLDNKDIVKFIPASGAATRMFENLFKYLDDKVETDFIKTFKANLDKFSFYNSLNLKQLSSEEAIKEVLKVYGNAPKALLDIHTYINDILTPIDEHIFEGLEYIKNGNLHLHFTISKNHELDFLEYVKPKKNDNIKITHSFQEKKTDTLSVDKDDKPFITDDGEPLYRPGGHGALIHNLNNIDADIIYIKNIDNVSHQNILKDTVKSKIENSKIGLNIQKNIYSHINSLLENNYDLDIINTFLIEELNITYKKELTKEKALYFLDRPLRVCGVVKNQGEPGGGPFIVDNGDYLDPQIVEMKEIDLSKDQSIVDEADYFNPVDIICFVKDYKGAKYDLLKYVNQNRYFISEKTYMGRDLKALEHPGLWNGAMHSWNTIFVEVPLTTFNPIKNVNDLLREGHLGYKI